MMVTNKSIEYLLIEADQWTKKKAEIITETPVSLSVNGEIWLTFMCTPIDLEAMAVGFLFNEGLIESTDEIEDVRLCDAGDNVDVWLSHSLEKPETWRRTSGCTGGVTSVSAEKSKNGRKRPKSTNDLTITPADVSFLIGQLFASQDLYQRSGGVHTSALSDGQKFHVVAEDIGRHNTLDKIAGRCLMENIHLDHSILLSTGRISSEMLQKASRIGAVIVISRTSPSSLSIKMADERRITLIGYAHRDRFRIYTHPDRILLPEIILPK
jgi:FdhD protein